MAIFAKGRKTLKMFEFPAYDRLPFDVIGCMMYFECVSFSAPLAAVAVPQSYEAAHLTPVVLIEDTSVLTPPPLVLESRH